MTKAWLKYWVRGCLVFPSACKAKRDDDNDVDDGDDDIVVDQGGHDGP